MLCWEKSSTFCVQSIDIDPWFQNRLPDNFSKKYEKNFKSDQKEINIATYFLIKKTSQTAYLCCLRGFYSFPTVKDGILIGGLNFNVCQFLKEICHKNHHLIVWHHKSKYKKKICQVF